MAEPVTKAAGHLAAAADSGEPQADPYEQITDAIAIATCNGERVDSVIKWNTDNRWLVSRPNYLKKVCDTARLPS